MRRRLNRKYMTFTLSPEAAYIIKKRKPSTRSQFVDNAVLRAITRRRMRRI